MPAQTIIKVRRDTAANWAGTDPVLAAGEHGYETDTGKFKIGDGTTHYLLLPYATDWSLITEKPTSFTPSAHKTSHEFGGSDAITIAQSQVADLGTALSAKVTNPMTTAGDLIVGGASGTPTRLGVGTNGQVLSSNGTTATWTAPAGGLPAQGTDTAGELLISSGSTASWSNTVTANAANVPALIAKGTTSQTANIAEFQTTAGVKAVTIDSSGVNARNGVAIGYQETSDADRSLVFYTNGSTPTIATAQIIASSSTGNIRITSLITATPAEPDTNANSAKRVGYVGLPQVSTSSAITATATWRSYAGEHIYTTTTGLTHTIPANSSQALEVGTTIVFINPASVTTTIAVNSDTLILAGVGVKSPSQVVLAPFGMATLVKITSTSWIASGNGLS